MQWQKCPHSANSVLPRIGGNMGKSRRQGAMDEQCGIRVITLWGINGSRSYMHIKKYDKHKGISKEFQQINRCMCLFNEKQPIWKLNFYKNLIQLIFSFVNSHVQNEKIQFFLTFFF